MPAAPSTSIDLFFRAFSDPVRLRLLHLLAEGELCVCDLVAILGLPQPTVSRHLSYLRRARLVDVRQQASWNYYTLAAARSPLHGKLLACIAPCVDLLPVLAKDAVRAGRIRKAGGRC